MSSREMKYSESAEGLEITQARAIQEIRKHGVITRAGLLEFFADCGELETYKASAVLAWLGY